jgi:hypothetical protein
MYRLLMVHYYPVMLIVGDLRLCLQLNVLLVFLAELSY